MKNRTQPWYLASLLSAGLLLAPALLAQSAPEPKSPADEGFSPLPRQENQLAEKIDRNLGLLRSSSPALREAGTKELSALEPAAIPLLQDRLDSAKAEGEADVAERLQQSIDAIRKAHNVPDPAEEEAKAEREEQDRSQQERTQRRSPRRDPNDYDSDGPFTPEERERYRESDPFPQDDRDERDDAESLPRFPDSPFGEQGDPQTDKLVELLRQMLENPGAERDGDEGESPNELPGLEGEQAEQLRQAMQRLRQIQKLMEEFRNNRELDPKDSEEGQTPERGLFPWRERKVEKAQPRHDGFGEKKLESGEDEY